MGGWIQIGLINESDLRDAPQTIAKSKFESLYESRSYDFVEVIDGGFFYPIVIDVTSVLTALDIVEKFKIDESISVCYQAMDSNYATLTITLKNGGFNFCWIEGRIIVSKST